MKADQTAAPRSSWSLPHALEERERSITHIAYGSEESQAAEREEQWHTAELIRRRYRLPQSWLDCVGLLHVPTDPVGWCVCPQEESA